MGKKKVNKNKGSKKQSSSDSLVSDNERMLMVDGSLVGQQGVVSIHPDQVKEMFSFELTDVVVSRRQGAVCGENVPIYVFKDDLKGLGVKASRDIRKGETVISYSGASETYSNIRSEIDDGTYVAFNLNGKVINARNFGNESRFINHAPSNFVAMLKVAKHFGMQKQINRDLIQDIFYANCVVVKSSSGAMLIVADRDIKEGEELVYDYGFDYWLAINDSPFIYNTKLQDVSEQIYDIDDYLIIFPDNELLKYMLLDRGTIETSLDQFNKGISNYTYAMSNSVSTAQCYVAISSSELIKEFKPSKRKYLVDEFYVLTERQLNDKYLELSDFGHNYSNGLSEISDAKAINENIEKLSCNLGVIDKFGSLFICLGSDRSFTLNYMRTNFVIDLISLCYRSDDLKSSLKYIEVLKHLVRIGSIEESKIDPGVLDFHRQIVEEENRRHSEKKSDDAVVDVDSARKTALGEISRIQEAKGTSSLDIDGDQGFSTNPGVLAATSRSKLKQKRL